MNKYRSTDYYDLTKIFDELYENAKQGKKFTKLMPIIMSDENIELAFRTIKFNTGSKTAGVDKITIEDIKNLEIEQYREIIKNKFNNYLPDMVRRVYIPKPNGDLRPLGIPTIIDRIIQQAIRQVLEPICEAKFHNHSYGFRPNRSTENAIARVNSLININGLHYVVDIDIKGFFDNVNHTKLIKQIYNLGIQDRKLLMIIKAMLKAPIENEGIPTKGTPQGGILSPLLSNIVLNELDWWISNQWETLPTKYNYSAVQPKYKALKRTKLKEVYIVRYADDAKILCRNYNHAKRIFEATKQWLKERLSLDISEEKSQIVNLKKNYSNYLGIKLKVIPRNSSRNGYVVKSEMSDKAKNKVIKELKEQVIKTQKHRNGETLLQLNSMILGMQQYYKIATMVSKDFREIAFVVNRSMFTRFKTFAKYGKITELNPLMKKFYGDRNFRSWTIDRIVIYPIHGVKHSYPMCFSQDVCDYTAEGRSKSVKKLKSQTNTKIKELRKHYKRNETIQYNDNLISRASMCNMKCEITGIELELDTIDCHRIKPKNKGGNDEYKNLLIVSKNVHKILHKEVITKSDVNFIKEQKQIDKLNKYRKILGLKEIQIHS
mgnify:CR=1 FL=1